MAVAAPLAAVGFFVPGPLAFFVLVFLVDIGLFASTSPVAAACLRSVPSERRASAMAATIFTIHLFGDLWSPAALGLFLDSPPIKLAHDVAAANLRLRSHIWWPRKREAASAAIPLGVHAGI